MHSLFIVIFLLTVPVFSTPVVITEVLTTSAKRTRDQNNAWVELTNVGDTPIVAEHIEMTIVSKGKTTTFANNIVPPLSFDKAVVIAQNKTLGLKQCIKNVPVVVVPDFSLPHHGELTVCATLNHAITSCLALPKKIAHQDGVAIFREPHDTNDSPLLAPEPCHLVDQIFATPGLPARACTSAPLREQIFDSCNKTAVVPITLSEFLATSESLITSHYAFTYDASQLHVAFLNDEQQPLVISTCAAPQTSKIICHIINRDVASARNQTSLAWQGERNEQLHFLLRDFLGATHRLIPPLHLSTMPLANISWAPTLKTSWNKNALTIEFTLENDERPLNVTVASISGTVLYQAAFVSKKPSPVVVKFNDDDPPVLLTFAGIRGRGQLYLSPSSGTDRGG